MSDTLDTAPQPPLDHPTNCACPLCSGLRFVIDSTAPQPPPCCDPSAPVVKCCVCGTDVHTCERTEPVDNDYRCPAHVNGVEMSAGEWVCSDACGYERILAANWKRIAALEAELAEAQERLTMAVEALKASKATIYGEHGKPSLLGNGHNARYNCNFIAKWHADPICKVEETAKESGALLLQVHQMTVAMVVEIDAALTASATAVAEHEARTKAEAIQEAQRCVTPEQLAEIMHDVYEKESRAAGWNTQEACHVPFGELPEANKRVMLQVARAVLWATPDLAEMEARLKREGAAEELRRLADSMPLVSIGDGKNDNLKDYARLGPNDLRRRAAELEKKS